MLYSDIILVFSNNPLAINKVQKWFVEETRMGIPVDFTNERIRGINYDRGKLDILIKVTPFWWYWPPLWVLVQRIWLPVNFTVFFLDFHRLIRKRSAKAYWLWFLDGICLLDK